MRNPSSANTSANSKYCVGNLLVSVALAEVGSSTFPAIQSIVGLCFLRNGVPRTISLLPMLETRKSSSNSTPRQVNLRDTWDRIRPDFISEPSIVVTEIGLGSLLEFKEYF